FRFLLLASLMDSMIICQIEPAEQYTQETPSDGVLPTLRPPLASATVTTSDLDGNNDVELCNERDFDVTLALTIPHDGPLVVTAVQGDLTISQATSKLLLSNYSVCDWPTKTLKGKNDVKSKRSCEAWWRREKRKKSKRARAEWKNGGGLRGMEEEMKRGDGGKVAALTSAALSTQRPPLHPRGEQQGGRMNKGFGRSRLEGEKVR
ncbi:hypothetical protein JOQ06_009131, partial [Pogonophryne albipinna]